MRSQAQQDQPGQAALREALQRLRQLVEATLSSARPAPAPVPVRVTPRPVRRPSG